MDATGKGGSAPESMPGGFGRQLGPSGPEPGAGGAQAEAGSLWPFLRNAGGAQPGVGNPIDDWREEEGFGLGVKG